MVELAVRVLRELESLRREHEHNNVVDINLYRDETDLSHLRGTFTGPDATPYEGGVFIIDIHLPADYPFVPPIMKFLTKVWHPNIGRESGCVSLNALRGEWTAAMNLTTGLISLQALLAAPEPNDPQDDVVIRQYRNDYPKFYQKAKRWTEIYAHLPLYDIPDPPPQHNVQDHNAANAPPPPQSRRVARAPNYLNDYMF